MRQRKIPTEKAGKIQTAIPGRLVQQFQVPRPDNPVPQDRHPEVPVRAVPPEVDPVKVLPVRTVP